MGFGKFASLAVNSVQKCRWDYLSCTELHWIVFLYLHFHLTGGVTQHCGYNDPLESAPQAKQSRILT